MLKQLIKKEHLLTAFFLVLAVVLYASYHGKENRTDINKLSIILVTVGARRILMGPRLDAVKNQMNPPIVAIPTYNPIIKYLINNKRSIIK